ncbi:HU family DNA-binding protein [Streptomyces sp. 5.8]|uniref:HU family DNA-binding protein n=1 Tax=Streptomyces sp. 5.8 TaxID=3406571 RepID=UPI003BB6B7C7
MNKKLNKQQLINEIAANGNISKKDAAAALNVVLDTLIRRVISGDTVSVTGFGTFQTVNTPAHRARNPQTGSEIRIPERKNVRFSPGVAFTDMVRGDRATPPAGESSARKRPSHGPRATLAA